MALRKRDQNPSDLDTETLMLTAMMHSGRACEIVIEDQAVLPEHFYHPGHQKIAAAITQLYLDDQSTDAVAVAGLLDSLGLLDDAGGAAGVAQAASASFAALDFSKLRTHCDRVKDLAAMRVGLAGAVELRGMAIETQNPTELAERFRHFADEIDMQLMSAALDEDEYQITDLLSIAREGYDWLVDGVLERGDVFMLTAGGGAGKSLFMLQFCMQCSAGIHPFAPGRRIRRLRTLYCQVENTPNEEGRRVQSMVAAADKVGWDREGFTAWMPKEGINLTTPQGMASLRSKIKKHKPEIVVLSPWKDFHDGFGGAQGGEPEFMKVKRQLDTLRRKEGFALLIEAHASGAKPGSQDPDDYRPRGTVAQSNWATYGFCLIPLKKDNLTVPGRFIFGQWRGPRDRTRQFPKQMWEGSIWPWMPDDSVYQGPISAAF